MVRRPTIERTIYTSLRLRFLLCGFLIFITSLGRASDDPFNSVVPPSPLPSSLPPTQKPSAMSERLLEDRPLRSLAASIKPTDGELPPNHAANRLNEIGVLFDAVDDVRPWLVINEFDWDAPATRHLPLFFEEKNLERLGYTHRLYVDAIGYETDPVVAELAQPIVSGVHFVGCIAFAPYIAGVRPVTEPVYTLGVDRPGSPVLYRPHLPPISLRGAIYQAGVVCGLVFGIP